MSSSDQPTLGEAILAQVRGVKSKRSPRPADFVKDFVRHPGASRPAGSVALDFTCDTHDGRLMRLWMFPHSAGVTFEGEGRKGAWDSDDSGCGAVVVTCTRQGCRQSAHLTNDWLVARLRQVLADFEAGKGLPIAWHTLSQVGVPSA
jgi:hypothetical protein